MIFKALLEVVQKSSKGNPVSWPKFAKLREKLIPWVNHHPGLVLGLGAGLTLTVVVASFMGTQIYIQKQIDQRAAMARQDEVFLNLMSQLAQLPETAIKERQTIYLALGRLQDQRATSFLVDALAQETNENLIQALVQGIGNGGVPILPEIQSLNFQLRQQLQTIGGNNTQEIKQLALRLTATKQAIVQILQAHQGDLDPPITLDKIDLSGPGEFSQGSYAPNLNHLTLAGVSFRGTLIAKGNFKESIFFREGNNFVQTTDFSGSDLKDSNFTAANLTQANLALANLMRAQFYQANLTQGIMAKANLSGAKLTLAQLRQGDLQGAKLTGANLNEADLTQANLNQSSLEQITAIDANFAEAQLQKVNGVNGNFNQSDFTKADLTGADLTNSNFSFANLQNTNLQGTNLTNADLTHADLRGANLQGANFRNVIFAQSSNPEESSPESSFVAYPLTEKQAQIKGVNFNKVLNLSTRQLQFICTQGGIHDQCDD